MDGSSAYSFLPDVRMHDADWPVRAGSGGRAHSIESSKADPLRHPKVSGAVVLSVLSPKSHELEKSE